MATFLTAIFVVELLLIVALTIGAHSISSTLQARFPRLWQDLGEPKWLSAEYLPPSRHFFTFLDSKRYLETHDEGFIQLCRVVRSGFYVFLVLMAIMLLSGVAYVVLQSNPALNTDAVHPQRAG
jgi:hypothetical protein